MLTVYDKVDNLINKAPPIVSAGPARGFSATYFVPVRNEIHGAIGRVYRICVRVKL